MSKFMKILKGTLISLAVILGCGYLLWYSADKEAAKAFMDTLIEYANKPLPIVGFSAWVLFLFVVKILDLSNFGKSSLAAQKEEYEKEKEELIRKAEEEKIRYASILTSYQKHIDNVVDSMIQVCNVVPNKKVQQIGIHLSNESAVVNEKLKEQFDNIVNLDVATVIKTKEEIVNEIVDKLKKEIIDQYGEEGQKAIESIAEKDTL